jgi:hypothetical protein
LLFIILRELFIELIYLYCIVILTMKSAEELIRAVYEDPKKGLTGGNKLYARLKELHPTEKKITHAAVRNFLKKQDERQRFATTNGRQGSFIAFRPKQEYQVDLIYIKNSVLNSGNKYGMVCIDAFTKQCHIELMKGRKSKELDSESLVVLNKIFDKMGKPESVFCDEGSEFTSTAMKTMLDGKGVKLIFTTIHAPMVERVNRTIKDLINVWSVKTDSKNIEVLLPDVLENYNTSKHLSIGMTPNQAATANKDVVRANLELVAKPYVERPEVKVGDTVRYKEKDPKLKKGYAKPKFSEGTPAVVTKEEGQYTTDRVVQGKNKVYLRAHILKSGSVQKGKIVPNLEGTLEGRLKQPGGLKATGKTRAAAKVSAIDERKAKPSRIRKQVDSGVFLH